ncbi:MAG: hypothetical protein WBW31_01385 [Candidatus Sulfotelmatobacter sp.]
MTFPKSILLLIGLCMVAALVACSSSSHTTPPAAITVTVGAVPASVATNSANNISATTTDTAGVTWSCSPAPCGTFSPASTLTGANTSWTAPNVLSAGVTLTATSVTTPSISNSSTAIAVTAATLADGTYVFSLAGEDANSNYYVAGEITIAGGLITAGEQDFNDVVHDRFDQINGTVNGSGASTITTTADGNLQLSLLTCLATPCTASNFDPIIGPGGNGTETLNGVILPLSTTGRTFITEYDTSASASGELDLQDLTGAGSATPAMGYAFVLNGYDPGGTADPEAVGGIINIDDIGGVLGSISGAGSILDVNDGGTPSAGQTFAASTVSAPDALGRVIFTLNTSIFSQVLLAGYIVDSSHIRLVETHDTYSGCLGGVAYSQGANTGTFTTAASAAGTYVVGVQGFDTNGVLQAVSQLSLVAGAGVTGFVDYNDLASSSGISATSPDPVTAAGYTVDAFGAGDITIPAVTDATPTISYNVQLYLDGNGHALAITMDTNDIVAGAGYTQGSGFAATSFNGAYGLDVTGADGSNVNELDGVGPVNVTSGAIAGTVDLNWLFSTGPTYAATAVNGTTVTTGAGASNGIFTGTITGVDVLACIIGGSCSNDAFSYYLIDSAGDNIAIETDENQLTLGFFLQQ